MYATLGNRIVEIADNQVESYKVKGYEITDDNGNLVGDRVYTVAELKSLLADEQNLNAKLMKEIADLKAQLEKSKSSTASVVSDDSEPAQKKSTRKNKSAE